MRFHKLEEYLRTTFGAAMLGIGKGSADFAQLVRDAQKFYVGDVSAMKDVKLPSAFPRLPYPMCVFEFQDVDPDEVKRPFFLLAEELGYSDPDYDCIRVHSFVPYSMRALGAHIDDLWLHSGQIEINRKATPTIHS